MSALYADYKRDADRVRFTERAVANNETGCWDWTGALGRDGYGRFKTGRRVWAAHRWAYEHFVGPIPAGLQIDHLCRNRACCNPEHLEPVTARVNQMRSSSVSAIHATKAYCVKGHEFTPENTYRRPQGGRGCRACERERDRFRRMRRLDVEEGTRALAAALVAAGADGVAVGRVIKALEAKGIALASITPPRAA